MKIIRRFNNYLREGAAQDAFEQVLEDCINEGLSEDEIHYVIDEFLIPQIVARFAKKLERMEEQFQGPDDLDAVFETFCSFEGLSENLANQVVATINTAAAQEEPEDVDGDNEAVFKPDEWDELSDEKRREKVRAFLKKLAHANINFQDLKPFIKNLNMGDQANPYGIRVGEKE